MRLKKLEITILNHLSNDLIKYLYQWFKFVKKKIQKSRNYTKNTIFKKKFYQSTDPVHL